VIAVRRRGLTPEQKRALALYDNRTAELATWNADQLRLDHDAGLSLHPFWTDDEIGRLLGNTVKPGLTDPDFVPTARPTDVAAGDLFELGRHRLLCGDCTSTGDVARIVGTAHAALAFTSPPYGASNVAKLRDHYIKGREKRRSFYTSHDDAPGEWLSLMDRWIAAIRPTVDAVIVNVQLLADNKRQLVEWLYASREDLCDVIVWDKGHAAPQMQRNVLSNAFEFVLVFGGNGSRAIPFGDFRSLLNVVRINPKGQNEYGGEHRAVMPVALPIWVFTQLCPRATTCLEPFAGTGTTLIAAEQAARQCLAIEIEPSYCQLIIDRWEAFTGQKAVKVGAAAAAPPKARTKRK
jgi:DNA modification methylase